MNRIALFATSVLATVSFSQGAVVYNFDDLPTRSLHRATDGTVVWTALTSSRRSIEVVTDPADASNHLLRAASTRSEQVISILTLPGDSLFDLSAADTHFSISYTGTMSDVSGYMVGLWIDGVDPIPNGSSASSIEQELVLQFGVDASSRAWRVVGAGGTGEVHSSALGLPTGRPELMTVTLEVDLLGNSGDGSATLTVIDLVTNTAYTPYTNLSLNLLGNPGYTDPSKYTGWYLRNSQVDALPRRGRQVYPATLDDLALVPLPEPASLSVLVGGGVFLLRPRPRRRD